MDFSEHAPKPYITWGILVAALSGFEDHFRKHMNSLGLSSLNVGVNFPYVLQNYPNIILSINSLEVSQSGLYPVEHTDPVNELLIAKGQIGVQVFSESHNQLMSLVDFITQGYLMNTYDKTSLFHPALDKTYVRMEYGGGKLSWSSFSLTDPPDSSESDNKIFSSSTSFSFFSEHHLKEDLARVSAIDIEAVPLYFNIEE